MHENQLRLYIRLHEIFLIEALGCHHPPTSEEIIKPKKTEEVQDETTTEEITGGAEAVTEEKVTKEGCNIADPENSLNIEDFQNICEGGIKTDTNEMSFPWFKLCCTWVDHQCKPKTGQNLISKGILVDHFFVS